MELLERAKILMRKTAYKQWLALKCSPASESPGRSVSTQTADSVELGWSLKICISNKFVGDAADLGNHTLRAIAREKIPMC